MDDVVKAIEKLAEKDIIDYLLVIVPIVVSIVAIVISIATARKQNKIVLFERRFKCLSQIQMLMTFSDTIKNNLDSKLIVQLFDAYWGTDASLYKGTLKIIKAKSRLEVIVDEVAQAEFLFDCKYSVLPMDLVRAFHKVIIESVGDQVSDETIDKFCALCDQFYKEDFPKLKIQTKI